MDEIASILTLINYTRVLVLIRVALLRLNLFTIRLFETYEIKRKSSFRTLFT